MIHFAIIATRLLTFLVIAISVSRYCRSQSRVCEQFQEKIGQILEWTGCSV